MNVFVCSCAVTEGGPRSQTDLEKETLRLLVAYKCVKTLNSNYSLLCSVLCEEAAGDRTENCEPLSLTSRPPLS